MASLRAQGCEDSCAKGQGVNLLVRFPPLTARPSCPHGVGSMLPNPPLTIRWYPIRDAAPVLGVTPEALRKLLERRAVRSADGSVEALVDGVRARKFANRWRISFGKAWVE